MLGGRTLRDRSVSRDPDAAQSKKVTPSVDRDAEDATMATDTWAEPALAQKPSYRDHKGVSYYGVSEHMQPLGEAPSAKVKTRVRAEGARKSVLGRSAAGVGLDAQETPEGTPAPQLSSQSQPQPSPTPRIVVDDEDDADYAPKANGKQRERSTKPRVAKRRAEPASEPKSQAASTDIKGFDLLHTRRIVEEAKRRAIQAGKPDLAEAVNEIFVWSLKNAALMTLLQAILAQTATKGQHAQFLKHVKKAKKKIKDRESLENAAVRDQPKNANGTQSLPLRSPSKFTSSEVETSAIPSTEPADTSKAKDSLGVKPPGIHSRRRSSQTSSMAGSPSKARDGSPGSDSSLTDLTSNPDDDDMDVEEPATRSAPAPAAAAKSGHAKDHAAERGSLAAPNRNLKRSSAEAELQDDQRERELVAKKQKLNASITRDMDYEESNIRESADGRTSRLRTRQAKNSTGRPSALSVNTTGGRREGGRGSRAISMDLDSPLSTPVTASSRQSTPHVYKGPTKAFGKKAKTKQSPEKKQLASYGGMPGVSGAGRESPIGDDDNEELSENNDFCSACGGSGFLLCCDGCDRSFHFSCLDPPLNEDASELNEPWFCYICVAKRPLATESPEKPQRGIFAPLLTSLRKRNPSNFALPQHLRDYFEGTATDKAGSFVESVSTRTRNRPGYGDELPDFTKVKDAKGKTILCYSCGKSSGGTRMIITCDFCDENWHLDCLDPPRTNPPARNPDGQKIHDWMCPLHADQELRKVDASLLNPRNLGRKVHVRKPRNAKVVETSLRRGFRNNGVVDVVNDDESDDDGSDFYDEDQQEEGVVYRLPASGIKLDFIDKVKTMRAQQARRREARSREQMIAQAPRQLQQANFARRSFRDKQLALNLAQFATSNKDLELGSDQVENLIGTLIAEAPAEVVDEMTAAETAENAKSTSSAIPPSPPSSEQPEALSTQQRKELQMLQELIRRRLEGIKT